MGDPKPSRFFDLKTVISGIMALTALVTAATSLVKALDKRLEQASYETLSTHIADIQKDQAALREQVTALNIKLADRDGDGIPDADAGAPPVPTSSASAAKPAPADAGTHPTASATHPPIVRPPAPPPQPAAVPVPMPPPVATLAPPSWNAVKAKADKL